MVTVVVNFTDPSSGSTYRSYEGAQEVINAVKLLHPDWTSIVVTITKEPLKSRRTA